MNDEQREKRDIRRMEKMYEREHQRMVKMARRQERLIRRGKIEDD